MSDYDNEAVAIVMRLFRAMNEDEQKATILALGNEVERTGLVEVPEKARSGGGKARGGKKGKRPYWAKTVEKIDTSKKAAAQLVGEWTDIEKIPEMGDGTVVMLGTRYPARMYTVLVVRRGAVSGVDIGGSDGVVNVEGVAVLKTGSFKDCMTKVNEVLEAGMVE